MKLLFVVLDGAADVKIPEINGTPFEIAETPNMDLIAKNAKTGLLYPVSKNIAPESDQAILSLLGYDPFKYYTGRGPLEAMGAGIEFKKGEVVFRGNFSVEENGIIKEPSAPIDLEENRRLCEKLNENIAIDGVKFIPTKQYRFVMILSKKGNTDRIQNTTPAYEIVKNHVSNALPKRYDAEIIQCKPLDNTKEATATAELVNEIVEKTRKLLSEEDTVANYIVLRNAGTELPNLPELEGNWAMIADSHVNIAIGKSVGMQIIPKPLKNIELANTIIENERNFENIYLQIKSPDKYSHNKDYRGKIAELENIDKNFFGTLNQKLNFSDFKIILTADHTTSTIIGAHTSAPVPLAITSNKPDSVEKFTENECSKGELGTVTGSPLKLI